MNGDQPLNHLTIYDTQIPEDKLRRLNLMKVIYVIALGLNVSTMFYGALYFWVISFNTMILHISFSVLGFV